MLEGENIKKEEERGNECELNSLGEEEEEGGVRGVRRG